METFDLRLKSPFTAMVSGPTGSGKTRALAKLISRRDEICSPPPDEVIYCYGAWQPFFDEIPDVRFHEGMLNVLDDVPNDGKSRWIVLDDLMDEAGGKREANALFTKHSHHRNVSAFFVTQNFFKKELRTMSLNAHYLFLFKNPRDGSFITNLGKQLMPGKSRALTESYADATKKPHSYLLVDLRQDTDDRVRLIGDYGEESMSAYVVKE